MSFSSTDGITSRAVKEKEVGAAAAAVAATRATMTEVNFMMTSVCVCGSGFIVSVAEKSKRDRGTDGKLYEVKAGKKCGRRKVEKERQT